MAADMTVIDKTVPFAVTDPKQIPTPRYYDEEFFQLEKERFWPHVWQNACRLEQIPNVGDWIEYNNLGKSVIIVNSKNGIRAYHNACRHRGVPLTEHETHGNCKGRGFICPFHGWRWNTEGENTFVYGKQLFDEDQLNSDDLKLRECRVETFGGCAWINHDDDAPTLRETLGPLADNLIANGMDDLRAEWHYGTHLPSNWKVAMEAFMEGYHVMRTHPQLQRATPALYNQMYGPDTGGIGVPYNPNASVQDNIDQQVAGFRLLSEGMAGMLHAKELAAIEAMPDAKGLGLPDNVEEAMPMWFGAVVMAVQAALEARGEKIPNMLEVKQSHPVNAVEFLMPHYFLLPTFTSMSAYRIRPTGPETCFFEIWSLTHFPEGEEPEPVMEPTILPYDSKDFPPIPQQDYANIPIQQEGCHAEGFDFMRLSPQKEGMISNYNRIIDGYLSGVDQKKLAEATNKLGGNFDGPILDLGF